ncbi:MAG: SRPBCC domain-containing protein [Bacteroidota bacterium]|nr:SRPBCC domain-containing protein [Bacteroidota bacterium]
MKSYKQYFEISASQDEVFSALTNPFTIELWSGYPTIMDNKEGTEFSLWEGNIVGKNIEIKTNKLLVQEWYFGENTPQKDASIVTIKLFSSKKGTSVEVNHINIPDIDYENIAMGWNDYYMGAIKKFFEIE